MVVLTYMVNEDVVAHGQTAHCHSTAHNAAHGYSSGSCGGGGNPLALASA